MCTEQAVGRLDDKPGRFRGFQEKVPWVVPAVLVQEFHFLGSGAS